MRRFAIPVLAAAFVVAGVMGRGYAALDGRSPATESHLEILVLEVENCFACDLVRKHIQPAYAHVPRSRDVPLRYVDLNAIDEDTLGLTEAVSIVPTIVLRRDGKEVSRIAGYTGPATFLEAVEYMLAFVE